jgi:hypothetical protein
MGVDTPIRREKKPLSTHQSFLPPSIIVHSSLFLFIEMISGYPLICDLFGRVIGDPLHQTKCLWSTDKYRCSNEVPMESRRNGGICLDMARSSPKCRLRANIIQAVKYLLCKDCRGHYGRVKKCADKWMERLLRCEGESNLAIRSMQGTVNDTLGPLLWPTVLSPEYVRIPHLHREVNSFQMRRRSSREYSLSRHIQKDSSSHK